MEDMGANKNDFWRGVLSCLLFMFKVYGTTENNGLVYFS